MSKLNWGLLFTALWLIFTGCIALFHLTFESIGIVMAILAIVAGVFIIWGLLTKS
jgi:hypothetical protein